MRSVLFEQDSITLASNYTQVAAAESKPLGETTMRYFSQMVGLTVQNFLAGAAGLAVGAPFICGFVRQNTDKLGNFWVDLVRSVLWVLLPLALLVRWPWSGKGCP